MWATVIFYDDPPELLEASLGAIKDNGFKIICADGAFREWLNVEGYPLNKSYSKNGCADVAKKYADIYICAAKFGWLNEMEKRNACIERVPPSEYFWINDADEVLPKFTLPSLTENVYRVVERLHRVNGNIAHQPRNRVFKMYLDLQFQYQHCRLYRMGEHYPGRIDTGLVARSSWANNKDIPIIKDDRGIEICFDHYTNKRPKEWSEIKNKYCQIRSENKYPF
jgi:hypothetical protein